MLTARQNLLETVKWGNPDRFVNQYEGRTYSIELGEYQFTKESKTLAISSSSMMTHFTELA